jgi:hypothetical protein
VYDHRNRQNGASLHAEKQYEELCDKIADFAAAAPISAEQQKDTDEQKDDALDLRIFTCLVLAALFFVLLVVVFLTGFLPEVFVAANCIPPN